MQRRVFSLVHRNPESAGAPDLSPVTPEAKKRSCSNYMTRRAFAGLFFGMGMGTWKAARKSGLPPSLADEELRDFGYAEWARRTGRAE